MTVTISRLYDSYDSAAQAVRNLEAAGVPPDDISMIANNTEGWYDDRVPPARHDADRDGVDDRAEGAATGAGVGAALGGAAGLLAGLGMLAIPGLGPVVAAGWLAATAAGAVAGGAAGGAIGALTQAGVSEEDAHFYAEGVRRGGTLVTARVPDADQARIGAIMDSASVDLGSRRSAYHETGWDRFDPAARPYSAEEIRREREAYRDRR
ncbi:MAG: hypothetical protein AB7K86_14250 [Rhodospirillales bacterium]